MIDHPLLVCLIEMSATELPSQFGLDKKRTSKMTSFRAKTQGDVPDLLPQNEDLSLRTDQDWMRLREDLKLSVATLKKRYPAEWNSYCAMRGRAKTTRAVIAPVFRSFKGFLSAVGPCPGLGYTIDRIDARDPEYAPEKVRWASKVTQANNRTNTVMLTGPGGRVRSISEWAKVTRQKQDTLRKRHGRGWSDLEVISGQRGNSQPATVRTATGKWPAVVKDPGEFEKAWQAWTALSYYRNISRRAFFVWVATNIQRERLSALEQRFPDQIGECADPGSVPCPPLTDDAEYQRHVRLSRAVHDIRQDLSKVESESVEQLQRSERSLTSPEAILDRAAERRAEARVARSYSPPW